MHYITERGVFRLTDDGLLLTEIAPGVDLERDVLAHMGFRPQIAPDLREMDPAIFPDEPMGLRDLPADLDDRLVHRAEDNVLYVNLEGLHLDTPRRPRSSRPPGPAADDLGHRVHAIVNYDNLELGPAAAPRFFEMVRDSTRGLLPVRHALLDRRLLPPQARPGVR